MKIMKESGLLELIPEDSYVNTPEYKELLSQYNDAIREYTRLKTEIENIPARYKPTEEWSDLEQFMYDNFSIIPKLEDSDDVIELKNNLRTQKQLRAILGAKLQNLKKTARIQRQQYREYNIPKPTKNRQFEGFTAASTGMSFYDDFLDSSLADYLRNTKHKEGYIAEMSPVEYLECCADIFDSTLESQIYSTKRNNIEKYAAKMKQGTKFYMPVLNYADKTQEGRHRAQAAYLAGIKSIPVLIVTSC